MKFVKLGLIFFVFAAMLVFASLGNNEPSVSELAIENGLAVFKEENCIDNGLNKSCEETTYLSCNGETYEIPKPTGFVFYDKIFIEKEVPKIIPCDSKNEEKSSPADRIKESNIEVMENKVIVNIKNANWRKFIDSNSMDPFIDEGSTTIEIKPSNPEEIKVGDIIAFDVESVDYDIVHRVVEIGNDEQGIYFVTKGDNYYEADEDKVRFSQVEGIVVGILY